jgi:molybdopterin/thiamine biosynthesis adenylyltransferase
MTGGITLWKDRGYEVEIPRALTAEQRDRYSRHMLVPEIGAEGQQKLLDAKVLLLGAGGLGSPTALYLAAAGVGTLGIVDDDVVDLSNLQRQVIHTTAGVGTPRSTPPRRRSTRSTPT